MTGLKKRVLTTSLMVASILLTTACVTVALLTALAGTVENNFTIGKVDIILSETTGGEYALIPGKTIAKDPCVRVIGGSEDCWLYVTARKSEDFDSYLLYEIDGAWTPLDGYDGVYYQSVPRSEGDSLFCVLKDNVITVSPQLTEEKMSEITSENIPKISFVAYAIQREGVMTPADGYEKLLEGSE